ncbi:MAG TPA: ABC transporter ATP-binding protein [Pirellulaceae bacterium]|nr:ABC transporter ATP-binding protein [Pirellulaceae bacterium]
MDVIETRELTKQFGSGDVLVQALNGIDLRIESGELVAIMGPSGSGKSTLLAILGGVDVPTSGKVFLEGTDLSEMSDDQRTLMRRRRIGFVFQSFNLLPTLTAEENVSLPLELDGVASREASQRACRALELVEMSHRRGHIPSKLSGGEQQRVAIARALVIEPALVLADEPTGNLDSRQSRRVTDLLQKLVESEGHTIVMVTHDDEVGGTAQRLITLRDGLVEGDIRQELNRTSCAPAAEEK